MATNTLTLIVVAVVAVLLLILVLAFVARGMRDRKHRAEADRIREEVRDESHRVQKREAIAAETDAKARAAAAEAEAKAAEAARLADRATTHRGEAASSREHLDAELERADGIDPRFKADRKSADVEDDDKLKRDEVHRAESDSVGHDAPHRVVN
jgi:Tfp pilus assembly protein PilE